VALITAKDHAAVVDAIAAAERTTNAEIITVLARASDDYLLVGLAGAAIIALVLGTLALLAGLDPVWIVTGQLIGVCALLLLFRFTTLAVRFVPLALRHRRAEDLARRQFLEQRLHHTVGHTGFLIFVSEAEHYVEIIADRGIAAHVDDVRWHQIIERFVAEVRRDRAVQGLIAAIAHCGEVLAEVVPKTPDNRNELDDRLVLIGY
jgi:putative membrane protein